MITAAQKVALREVIDVLTAATAPKSKRQLAALFMDLVSRKDWPDYYEVRD
jgi:chromatin structure-remodeling complex subunit RSC1/2